MEFLPSYLLRLLAGAIYEDDKQFLKVQLTSKIRYRTDLISRIDCRISIAIALASLHRSQNIQ